MPSYVIYSPDRFPEVFNAVKPLGEVAAEMPNIIALHTEKGIDDVNEAVRAAAAGKNSLVVEAKHAQYSGDGKIGLIGKLLDRP